MNLIGQPVEIIAVYTSTKGNNYYRIVVEEREYLVNAAAFFLTGDAGNNPVVEIGFAGNFLSSKKDVATTAIINKSYDMYTIDEKLVDANGKTKAAFISTTSSMDLIGQTVDVIAVYTSTTGYNYYRIAVNGKEYIISAAAFEQTIN
ncbi:hypothetical protein RyT2_10620 [Pseudolactococcus yaeyamensis]